MRRIPRRLLQNRQVLGYDVELRLHFLVLPARRQSIEQQGEDFLCIRTKLSAIKLAQTFHSLPASQPHPFA
jgi:hypothetical protein